MAKNNTLLLKALRGEEISRPPVWMMRQAGRYLPDFRKIKEKYDFFTRCRTPELATEITIMPIKQIKPDAAILFSDILVVPQAMGIHIEMKSDIGPFIEQPIRSKKMVDSVEIPNVDEKLDYVFKAIKLTQKELPTDIPLLGFAGAPWTIFCYIVEGQGSKNFSVAKKFCFENPIATKMLLEKITKTTIEYLKGKVKAGVDAIQLFDSWGGILSQEDYLEFSMPYNQQIIDALKGSVPIIFFAKDSWYMLDKYENTGVSAVGVDWKVEAKYARKMLGNKITIQGNLDPSFLYMRCDARSEERRIAYAMRR